MRSPSNGSLGLPVTSSPPTGDAAAPSYRCSECGNRTRFDVVSSRRTRAFHHFSVGGGAVVEDEEVLDERVESVTCRWCGATGPRIEVMDLEAVPAALVAAAAAPAAAPATAAGVVSIE